MKRKTRAVGIFVFAVVLIMVGALVSIFVGRLKPQLVAPVAGMASVLVFVSRFNAAIKDEFGATPMVVSSTSVAQSSGITFLRIVTIATLCVGALMIVTFVVEDLTGTLDFDDVWRFVPKAAFAVALAGYVFHKTKSKSPP